MTTHRPSPAGSPRRALIAAIVVAFVGVVFVAVSRGLNDSVYPGWLLSHKDRLFAVELLVFGVAFVELAVRALLLHQERQRTRQFGITIRAIVRALAYTALGVSILTVLSANPAFAAAIGSMVGLIVGFSTQNVIANVFAGMFLALSRPFQIDDEVAVAGVKGRVVEMNSMHTVLNAEGEVVLIPNLTMLTQVIRRTKPAPTSEEF